MGCAGRCVEPRVLARSLVCSPVPGVSHFLTQRLFPTVSEPQAARSAPEKPTSTAILCNTCGNVCRGEVLRVQSKYFHIQCFVCKGERRPVSAMGPGAALPCGRARLPAATLGPRSSLDLGCWKNRSQTFIRQRDLFSVARVPYGGDGGICPRGKVRGRGPGPGQCPRMAVAMSVIHWPEQSGHLGPVATR